MEPVLAQATGFYSERPATGLLREFFFCTFVHRMPEAGASPIVVVPDGCMDLQWIDGGWRIAGPDREPQTEIIPAGRTIVGFRFRPAVGSAWLGVPACEIVNQRVMLDELWGSKARRIAAAAAEAPEPGALIRALEQILAKQEPSRVSGNRDMKGAFELLAAGAPPGRSLIAWLADELVLSERTLRRRFDETFGYGPKTLDRILRYQRFLRLARESRRATAAELAAEAGYSDQSHLVRESRRLTGATPREITALVSRSV